MIDNKFLIFPCYLQTITCTDHPSEKITLYCDGCQKPVCVKCKFSEKHAKHKVAVIERKYAIVKVRKKHFHESIYDLKQGKNKVSQ